MKGLKVCIILIILTLAYLASTVLLSNLFFHKKSTGSLVKSNDTIIGSKLIGQEFKSNYYFHGRPSFYNYKSNISGNSNLPYYSESLLTEIISNYNKFKKLNPNAKTELSLIAQSASGLDPHITYNAALSQIERISIANGVKKEILLEILNKKAKPSIFGLLGEKIVNVLELNIELKKLYAKTS